MFPNTFVVKAVHYLNEIQFLFENGFGKCGNYINKTLVIKNKLVVLNEKK